MKHKQRQASRRQPIQAPQSESGPGKNQEEVMDEHRQQKARKEGGKKRDKGKRDWKEDGARCQRVFHVLQCNFPDLFYILIPVLIFRFRG